MKDFECPEPIFKFGGKVQRLMWYPKDGKYEDLESEKLREFKEWCRSKKLPIPDWDPECLVYLQRRGYKCKAAYDDMVTKIGVDSEKLPI